ncbi:MAG TPA: AAA family ATPase, partial [Polyangiaceae bacterium]|nr:AAA family ATPase [Polyangiaceae bacterium]
MGLADTVLGHEQPASREPRAGARTPFDGVNDLDPVAVADALGIERDGRKVKCCPGCGASSGCDIMDRGIVCQHDTCKAKTHNHDGFYSNVDLIALVRRGTVREAIGWASERFGTAQWINREPTTHAPEGAPKSTTPYDGGPWLSTSTIFEPLPPPAFVVPDLQIGPGRASCFAAYAGAGKTIAMQSLALSVASEQPIWGWFRHRGPGRVRHADQDQGAGTLRRYQRLARGMGLRPEDLGGRLEVSTFPELYLVDTSDDVWLRACDGVDLMILDALRGFTPGVEENDSQIQ